MYQLNTIMLFLSVGFKENIDNTEEGFAFLWNEIYDSALHPTPVIFVQSLKLVKNK